MRLQKSKEVTKHQSKKKKPEFKEILGKDIAFTSGKNLQQILFQKNKPKLLPKSQYWRVKKEGSYTMHRTSTG